MSSIKNRKRKNNDDGLSKHSQDAEIVIRQELKVFLGKTIQSKMKNDNEKTFSHEFSNNDVVNYIALVEMKRTRSKNLEVKRKYQILLKRNKRLQIFFRDDKINISIRRRRSAVLTNNNFLNKIF